MPSDLSGGDGVRQRAHVQDVLDDPDWDGVLTAEDARGLTPLFWSHVLPYGEVKLDMNTRLALSGPLSV